MLMEVYTNGEITSRRVYKIQDADGRCYGKRVRVGDGEEKQVWWQDHKGSGLSPNEFPFYGSEQADNWAPDDPVLIVEGEKARDAADVAGFDTLGTLGTAHLPAEEFFEVLRDRVVILWPDNDEPGRQHMQKIAEKAHEYAAEVLVYEWPEAPDKGDAVDHPAVKSRDRKALDRLLNDILSARRWEPPRPEGLRGRVRLGDLIRGGIEPTPQLLPDLLYEGRIHSIASGPGTGKTFLAEWMCVQVMRRESRVLYLDAENGPKLVAERLEDLGADLDTLDDRFFYYPADVDMSAESLAQLAATVEEIEPALVVFDSFADFLALAGLEENSNSECTIWMTKVAQPLKDAGVAVLILDHVPKSGKGPRGAGSKVAKVDVQWDLDVTIEFDRDRTGEIQLEHSKDRECWLPKTVRFSVGGGVFARSHGTIEEPDPETRMTENASRVYDHMRKAGEEGVRWSELLEAVKGSKGNLTRGLTELGKRDLFEKRNNRYRVKGVGPQNPIDKPNSQGTTKYQEGTTVPSGTSETGKVPQVPPPFRGGTVVPDAVPDDPPDYNALVEDRTATLRRQLEEEGL
jgi:hypothetical protein